MAEQSVYYDGGTLLSYKDLKGRTPEIFMCCGNRSSGKTTFFSRYLVKRFKERGEKFMLVYRNKNELKDVERQFFDEIGPLFFPEDEMDSVSMFDGEFLGLELNGNPCGYAVAVNTANKLRKMSHVFADTCRMYFDEFQSETGEYCPREITKFMSLHVTVARGGGKQSRYVPVYMTSNSVSLLNPYFTAMGVSTRLNSKTKFLRGNGWVLEQNHNPAAADAQRASLFNQAFSGEKYLEYAAENVYLNDDTSFISTPYGQSRYICTLSYKGKDMGVRRYDEAGIVYCDRKPDPSYPLRIAVTLADHSPNRLLAKSADYVVADLKYYFTNGLFRFKNLVCKEAVMTLLSF